MKHILTINAGSATLKFGLFSQDSSTLNNLYKAQADKNIMPYQLEISTPNEEESSILDLSQSTTSEDFYSGAIDRFIHWLSIKKIKIDAVSHRVVHGGMKFCAPILIDDAILQQLSTLNSLAPLHQPFNLQGIQQARQLLPDCPHIACFDTAFHHTNPALNKIYAIPAIWAEQGVRRYGFHGLSYAYIQQKLLQLAPEIAHKKVIIAHLGQGASLCALHRGKSILTSMGFSALDGLVMGTRCGSLDPGVILYWLQTSQYSAAEITDILYKKSGLLGVSEISNDMRDLLSSDRPKAILAIDLFVQRVVQQIGLLIAELEGIDAIIFTAGIGEHAPSIRAAIAARLQWLGLDLDMTANANNEIRINTTTSKIQVYVIPTDEEYMLAHYAVELLNG